MDVVWMEEKKETKGLPLRYKSIEQMANAGSITSWLLCGSFFSVDLALYRYGKAP
jgi:hypothetical protein